MPIPQWVLFAARSPWNCLAVLYFIFPLVFNYFLLLRNKELILFIFLNSFHKQNMKRWRLSTPLDQGLRLVMFPFFRTGGIMSRMDAPSLFSYIWLKKIILIFLGCVHYFFIIMGNSKYIYWPDKYRTWSHLLRVYYFPLYSMAHNL